MPKKILIIDDEALITTTLRNLLGRQGHAVVVAGDAASGLRAAREQDFDLIITDVRMPGTDGVEAVKQIRACLREHGKKPVPEIFITGYADLEKYEAARSLGAAAWLYKPFDNEELLRAVDAALGRRADA